MVAILELRPYGMKRELMGRGVMLACHGKQHMVLQTVYVLLKHLQVCKFFTMMHASDMTSCFLSGPIGAALMSRQFASQPRRKYIVTH